MLHGVMSDKLKLRLFYDEQCLAEWQTTFTVELGDVIFVKGSLYEIILSRPVESYQYVELWPYDAANEH